MIQFQICLKNNYYFENNIFNKVLTYTPNLVISINTRIELIYINNLVITEHIPINKVLSSTNSLLHKLLGFGFNPPRASIRG
nr:MAG TPA: hypothetical protein [Caudoviricetes sp.]